MALLVNDSSPIVFYICYNILCKNIMESILLFFYVGCKATFLYDHTSIKYTYTIFYIYIFGYEVILLKV